MYVYVCLYVCMYVYKYRLAIRHLLCRFLRGGPSHPVVRDYHSARFENLAVAASHVYTRGVAAQQQGEERGQQGEHLWVRISSSSYMYVCTVCILVYVF